MTQSSVTELQRPPAKSSGLFYHNREELFCSSQALVHDVKYWSDLKIKQYGSKMIFKIVFPTFIHIFLLYNLPLFISTEFKLLSTFSQGKKGMWLTRFHTCIIIIYNSLRFRNPHLFITIPRIFLLERTGLWVATIFQPVLSNGF